MALSPSVLLDALAIRPEGATSDQLHELLLSAGIASDKLALVRTLDALQREGRLTLWADRRWRAIHHDNGTKPYSRTNRTHPEAPETLIAAPVSVTVQTEMGAAAFGEDSSTASGAPTLAELLPYYEANLRRDVRGAITQLPERHKRQFLVLAARGAWWPTPDRQVRLTVRVEHLPPEMRESLARLDSSDLTIGYPLQIVRTGDTCFIRPIVVLGARRTGDSGPLVLDLTDQLVVINADWLDGFARATKWRPEPLREHLLGGDERGLRISDLAHFSLRLGEVAATSIRERMDPRELTGTVSLDETTIVNAAAVFLANDQPYTRNAAADVARLREMHSSALRGTALEAVVEGSAPQAPPVAVLNPIPLTEDQLEASISALSNPLTVVTGPPGTGKTQVILAVISSALAQERTVLFASRNHQAIDAVEERCRDLLGDRALLTRARDRAGENDLDFVRAIDAILAESLPDEARSALAASLDALNALDGARQRSLHRSRKTGEIGVALSDVAERLEHLDLSLPDKETRRVSRVRRLLRRLLVWLRGGASRDRRDIVEPPGPGASRAELQHAHAELKAALDDMAAPGDDDPAELTDLIANRMAVLLPRLVEAVSRPDDERSGHLRNAAVELSLRGGSAVRNMSESLAREVLSHRPVWAVSTLAAPRRIPLIPTLFDLVIFDEASQCDIASAIPLLVRARSAVVVGDPQQLSVIPTLTPAQDRELLASLGLDRQGIGRFAQSSSSLFDLAAAAPDSHRVMLREQFRSDPDIVEYLNEAFYGMRLRPRCLREHLVRPAGMRPGLHWTDVRAEITTDGSRGSSSQAEADAITTRLTELVKMGYAGSVGVIALFNQQVRLIERTVRRRLDRKQATALGLKIATVDSFQGGERDLILLSLAAGADMPAGARRFIGGDRRRFNVAVSRARAICEVIGNLDFARSSGIRHLARLAERAGGRHESSGDTVEIFESPWEERLYDAMRGRGLDPQPQYEIAGRRLDFALFEEQAGRRIQLDIEVDGRTWHTDPDGERKTSDIWRDHQLRSLGWSVRRFWVYELRDDMESCLDRIERDLGRR